MLVTELPQLWPGQPGLSLILWALLLVIVLYISRRPAHQAIRALSRVLYQAMHLTARSVIVAAERLKSRNREVLFEMGRDMAERQLTRDFERMETVVHRDLAGFPTIYRKLDEQLIQMEEDYSSTAEVPPTPDAWIKAIDAVAQIPSTGDSMVADVLGNIHESMKKAQKTAIDEYREVCHEKHHLLKKLMPSWRKVSSALTEVKKHVDALDERSRVFDNQLEKYNLISSQSTTAERMLSSSSYTQFVISAFVLMIAIGGAIINFNLISYPMQEMVGGNSYIGDFKTSNVAALVIILVELAMGLFLMESLRFTRLFPVIGALDDKLRTRMIWISLSLLIILASVESSLAYMRELMAEDRQALTQQLSDVQIVVAADSHRWITTVGQMIMGFILPFALTFVAIPLESFIHSSRTVLGVVVVALLRALAFLLRFVGNISASLGKAIVHIYDIVIFVPLWIEDRVTSKKTN